jgi:hypothetical protein
MHVPTSNSASDDIPIKELFEQQDQAVMKATPMALDTHTPMALDLGMFWTWPGLLSPPADGCSWIPPQMAVAGYHVRQGAPL